ncbi:MAG: FecR domain-containing protein [Planctomycetota bacterium]
MTESRWEQLFEGFLDEALGEDDCRELLAWCDADPANMARLTEELRLANALTALQVIDTEEISRAVKDGLQRDMSAIDISQRVRQQLEDQSQPQPTHATPARSLTPRSLLSVAAVFLLVASATWMLGEGAPEARTVTATVLRANSTSGFEPGDTLHPDEVVRLDRGRLVVRFRSGAKLAIEGPADLVVTGQNSAQMKRGIATVRVPGVIKGFTLDTPHEQVVDLGTSFGVAVADDGVTSIAVFEGEIELRGEQHATGPQRLLAGTSVRVQTDEESPREIPHAINPYLGTWQLSFGVNNLVGDVRVATPTERQSPGQVFADDSLLLFPEREDVALPRGFVVDAIGPGEHQRPFRKRTTMLPKDVNVDSFLLQFNPVRDQAVWLEQTFRGEVHFDRPIVALILQKDLLDASDALLALPETDLQGIFRRGINATDVVTLSDNRRVLHVALNVANGVDQIRVLVASDNTLQ